MAGALVPRVRDDIARVDARQLTLGGVHGGRRRRAPAADRVRRLLLAHGRPGNDPVHRQRQPRTSAAPGRGWPTTSTWSRTSTSGPSSPTADGSSGRPASTPTATPPARPGTGPMSRTGSAMSFACRWSSTASTGARRPSSGRPTSPGSPKPTCGPLSALADAIGRRPAPLRRHAARPGRVGSGRPRAGCRRVRRTYGEPESISAAAQRWIGELVEDPPPQRPSESKIIQAVAARARLIPPGTDPLELAARARVRTRTGTWLLMYGTRLSGGPGGRTAVIIHPATPQDVAPVVALSYGLTDRESQVAMQCIQGRATKEIARALSMSPVHRAGPPQVHLRQDRRTDPRRTGRPDLPRPLRDPLGSAHQHTPRPPRHEPSMPRAPSRAQPSPHPLTGRPVLA